MAMQALCLVCLSVYMRTTSIPDATPQTVPEQSQQQESSDSELIESLRNQLLEARTQSKDWCAKYEEIRGSTAYRMGDMLSRSPLGAAYRAWNRKSRRAPDPQVEGRVAHGLSGDGVSSALKAALADFPVDEPIALAHPEWLGIRSSATQMFDNLACIGDDLTPVLAEKIAALLVEKKPSAIVFHGFPYTYQYLVEALHRDARDIPLYAVWHGTFMQATEDYAWRSFRLVCALQRQGKIRRIGCVKRGQEEILRGNGVDAVFLLNAYRRVPVAASIVEDRPVKLGIWSISELRHKPPYEMLAAASLIEGAKVVGSVATPRMMDFCEEFGIEHDFVGKMVAQPDMPRHLATCHLNLYVTLNECAPMLPLESFAVGVPCIMGPNTPYFADDAYLREKLVVNVPDDASEIAARIRGALVAREEIIAAYREYALRHNQASASTIHQFLT